MRRSADQKVDMGRTVSVAVLRANHITHRTIHRNQVTERAHRAQMVSSLRIGVKRAAHVHYRRVVLLQIVDAMIVRLPDLYRGVWNPPAGRV